MANVKHVTHYGNHIWQNWAVKVHGPKPSEAQLALAHVFGRPGKQSLVVAMAQRDAGITRSQMLAAAALFDGKPTPQLNHMKALIADGTFSREAVPGAYVIKLSDKGQKWVELQAAKAVPVEAAKPKAKAVKAPRKPKATVTAPASDGSVLIPATPVDAPVSDAPQA